MPRRWLQTLIFTGVFLTGLPVSAEIPSGVIKQSMGRDFGIFTGDLIHHEFTVQLPADYQIAKASLPGTGELNYWLVLQDLRVNKLDSNPQRQLYKLQLTYQTFYAPLDVRTLQIPSHLLRAHLDGDKEINITLPDWTFTMSPLKAIAPRGVGNHETTNNFMKPALPPAYQPLQLRQYLVKSLAGLLVILTLVWAFLKGWIWRRKQSPFQQAGKQIKRLQADTANELSASYAAFESIHTAFNQTAGFVLFAHQIPVFLDNHPAFADHAPEIRDFFRQSDAIMFGQQTEKRPSLKTLSRLASQLSRAETLNLARS